MARRVVNRPSGGGRNLAALVRLGLEAQSRGDLHRAAEIYRSALAVDATYADALHLLGVVNHMQDRNAEARKLIERAIRSDRRQAGYFSNLARVHMALGDTAPARRSLKRALHLDNGFLPALMTLGHLELLAGRADDAAAAFAAARARAPGDADAALGHAMALRAAGDRDAALDAYDAVLALRPHDLKALADKGALESERGRMTAGLAAYDTATGAAPEAAELHANRGAVLTEMGRNQEAIAAHRAALTADPAFERSRWAAELALPIVYETETERAAARRRWTRGLGRLVDGLDLSTPEAIERAYLAARSTPAFLLHYQGENDYELMRRWGGLIERIAWAAAPDLAAPIGARRAPDRLRVGFVSSFFTNHAVLKIHHGWITGLDRSRFEIVVIHTGRGFDAETRALMEAADRYVHLPDPDLDDLRRIRKLDLDALVVCDVGMDPASQVLAAFRLARVQANGLGHPITTGLANMDYALASDLMEPPDGAAHYSETLVRLANLASCYRDEGIPWRDEKLERGPPLLFCAQSLYKLLPEDDDIFARIALEAGPCTIRFIRHPSDHVTDVFRRRMSGAFAIRGLDPNAHIEIVDRLDQRAFYAACGEADLLLDSFAWSGNNSTLEGLATGTPVVTVPGAMMRSRHAAAILRRIGLDDLVAKTRSDYVALAVKGATDPTWRAHLRETLRVNRHRAYNDIAPVRDLEGFFTAVAETSG